MESRQEASSERTADETEQVELPFFQKISKLGEGTYGVVYKELDTRTNEIVAVKIMRLDHETEGVSPTTLRELTILRSLDHCNIIRLKDASVKEETLSLVFEYMDCDLRRFLKMSKEPMDRELIRSYAYQMLCGIYFLHIHRVIHRDIKPENLLIDKAGSLKLCDFGLSRYFTLPSRRFTEGVVTLWYRPPEVLLHNDFYEVSIDVWSAGCVIAEMYRGTALFMGDSELDLVHKIFKTLGTPDQEVLNEFEDVRNNKISIPQYEGVPWKALLNTEDMFLIDLIQKMLTVDPKRRITAKEALKHPYFNDIPCAMKDLCYPIE